MDSIFHEKQEGSLCAQHCLNALLQGSYFTPVDLATLANDMDNQERLRMAEYGVDTEEYRRFIQQPSGNMDDSGFFSVQVICSALDVWSLELVPYNSSDSLSKIANEHPENMTAYICNCQEHWFTIRKIGYQWFNLNSTLSRPELVSNTHLSMFLAQLRHDGYSIFIVKGNLPHCIADDVLKENPIEPVTKPSIKKEQPKDEQEYELEKAIKMSLDQPIDKDEEDLRAAIQLSLQEDDNPSLDRAIQMSLQEDDNPSLDRAIQMSLQINSAEDAGPSQKEPNNGQLRSTLLDKSTTVGETNRLSKEGQKPAVHQPRVVNIPITVERSVASPPVLNRHSSPDAAEIRRRRLAYLDSKNEGTGR